MSESQTSQATPPAAPRSRKLTTAVIILALLPLVLPLPFYGLAGLWFGPAGEAAWQACQSFDCPAAIDLDKLTALVVLGPSILAAITLVFLGVIGWFRARWHPTSPINMGLFYTSIVCGLAWVFLLGCILGVIDSTLVYL